MKTVSTFGLSENEIQKIHGCFRNYPQIKKAIIYGSRAKGNFQTGSDIDLTLLGESLTLSIRFKIQDEFDDLMLPYKIDLSLFHEISNKDLIEHINRVGKVFYES